MKKAIYLDNASSTCMNDSVLHRVTQVMQDFYANPSSVHSLGLKSKKLLEDSREYLLSTLSPSCNGRIYFTSGGTESDNWAIKGIAGKYKKGHIITSKIEHNAVLRCCQYLQTKGYDISYINVDQEGLVDLKKLEQAIRPDTILISIMFANNEIGTIQPIKEIGAIAKVHGIPFHTDAVQAYGHVPINVDEFNIDLLSVSSHKFHGPKGVGFLYVRNGISLESLIHGGRQEDGLRAGTENLPGIAGMQKAASEIFDRFNEKQKSLCEIRDYFIHRLLKEIDCSKLNGSQIHRLPANINISFKGFSAGKLLDALDQEGICVSTGSACASGSGKQSHVLAALHLSDQEIDSSLRFTLNHDITKQDIDYVIKILKKYTTKPNKDMPINIFSINNISYGVY